MGIPARTRPLPSVDDDLAVVVIDNRNGGTHAGIVFRPLSGERCFVHLAFHHLLCVEAEPAAGLFGVPDVPDRLKNHLLMLLEKIEPANRSSINYAFGYDGTTVFDDDTAAIRVGAHQLGLTCATFVLAVFDSVAFPLVDVTSWLKRDDDSRTMDALLALLRRHEAEQRIPAGYSDRAAADAARAVRFRPEDVLAAATEASSPPHALSTVFDRSAEIRSWVLDGATSP